MLGKVNSRDSGDTGGTKINIFTQIAEPDVKDGIWIQTANQYKSIIVNNQVLNETGVWGSIGTITYNFYSGCAVVYNGVVHLLGSGSSNISHYILNNGVFTSIGRTPQMFHSGCAVVYNNEIHLLGGYAYRYMHYKFNGSSWTGVGSGTNPMTQEAYFSACVVFNNEIHVFGGQNSASAHSRFNGVSWTTNYDLPFQSIGSGAVVYNGEIHLFGGTSYPTKHYKWNGSSWTSVSTIPYNYYCGSSVVYNGEIHLLGGNSSDARTSHYKYNGISWVRVSTLPYSFCYGSSVVLNTDLLILGSNDANTSYCTFTTPENIFEPFTLILQRKDNHNGVYLTAFFTDKISGELNRFLSGFDDVYYFGATSFEWNAPMYYGDGTKWIKFKN